MPVVPIYLNIDDKTYQGIKAGTLELYGLAKNANTKRVEYSGRFCTAIPVM